jgi:hypothetical protein
VGFGLKLLPLMLRGFADVQLLVPGFFSLTLAGGLLALAYQRTGDLNFSIGLHAGWIFCIKGGGVLTSPGPAGAWFWGTGKLFDGWLAHENPRRNRGRLGQRHAELCLSGRLPDLRRKARHAGRGICVRRMPAAGAVHPPAVLRALRPAVRGRHHHGV